MRTEWSPSAISAGTTISLLTEPLAVALNGKR